MMLKDSTAANIPASKPLGSHLRSLAFGSLFAVVLLVPKLLHVRRDPRSWLALRVTLFAAGVALVILPLGLWNSWLAAVTGLAMFLVAVLLPPAQSVTGVDDKAKELGALIVVNGGEYQSAASSPAPVQLFVSVENVWALDSHWRILLTIPIAEISSVQISGAGSRWSVAVRWSDHAVDFRFGGIFAEHLARVAHTTLQAVVRPALPVLPQKRAASA
jgi:hypothetical protein